jgi:hypothetical protein
MKNYKILENRAELTKEQITQGMSFATIQAGALFPAKVLAGKALIKTVAAKTFIAKTVISIGIVSAVAIVYQKNNDDKPPKENALIVKESTPSKREDITPKEVTKEQNIIKEVPSETYTKTPCRETTAEQLPAATVNPIASIQETEPAQDIITETKKDEIIPATEVKTVACVASAKQISRQSQNAKCIMWNTNSFCNNAVSRPELSLNMECNDCEFNTVSCHDIDKMSNIKAVWLTINVSGKGKFRIESNFKNFSLERSNGEIAHPVAMGVGASPSDVKEPKYYSSNFKATKLITTFKKQIDIFLFFENAKVGDKVKIDNFIQAEIVE